jgi:hypothetical protein
MRRVVHVPSARHGNPKEFAALKKMAHPVANFRWNFGKYTVYGARAVNGQLYMVHQLGAQ